MWTRKRWGTWARKALGALLLVAPFVTACGNLSDSGTGWPARIVSVDAGDSASEDLVRQDMKDLETEAKRTLFVDGEPSGSKPVLQITIRRVPDWTDAPRRAGYATMEGDSCLVELAERLFTTHAVYRKTVVWHELGHCAGLNHDPDEGEVMSATTSAFSSYDAATLERFIGEFEKSAGLLSEVSRLAIGIMFPEE